MIKIYVAHPYKGLEENKKAVEDIIRNMMATNPDRLYISPINAFGFMYKEIDYILGMRYCFQLLGCCDMLFLCGDWKNSRGCVMEKHYAEAHGIPIRIINTEGENW